MVNKGAQRVTDPAAFRRLERRSDMTEERRKSARERMLTIGEENADARNSRPEKGGLRLLHAFG